MATLTLEQRKQALRQNIMLAVKANNLPVTGDLWLSLVFRTESELVAVARELHLVIAPTTSADHPAPR
jgi:hypothetical protein